MRLRFAFASLICFILGVAVLHAQVPMTGAGRPAPGGGAPAVTWNCPSDVGAGITCSGGNLVADNGAGGTTNVAGRATTSHSTGQWCYEFTVTLLAGNEFNVGWASGAMALSTGDLFAGTNRAGMRVGDSLYFNTANTGFFGAVQGDNFMLCIDFTANKVYATKDGSTWAGGGSPTAGTGGQSIVGLTGTPWFPAFVMSNATTQRVTARFSSFIFSLPSPFLAW